MEAQFSGVLRRRTVDEGETLIVGSLLGVIASADIDDAAIDTFISEFIPADATSMIDEENKPVSKTPVEVGEKIQGTPSSAPHTPPATKVRISPAVAQRAKELGVDISKVTGSGRGGRITQEDGKHMPGKTSNRAQ